MILGLASKQQNEDHEDLQMFLERDEFHRNKDISPPYAIVRDDIVGRHMVASRDIKPGETIFVESPLTFGPGENSKPICVGCYKRLRSLNLYCSKCNFPICSRSCQKIKEHMDYECKLFSKNGFKVKIASSDVDKEFFCYSIISPIRAFMMKDKDPKIWRLIWSQMSHQESRKKSNYWTKETKVIIDELKSSIGLDKQEDIEVFEILLGILLVNSFEIAIYDEDDNGTKIPTDVSLSALYGLASMPSHSCIANCTHDFSSRTDGYKMTMRSVTKIKKGEDITHSYSDPLDTVLQRRSLLRVGKFFICNCPRCSDPTELGTYSSALWCRKCKNNKGKMISSDTKDIEADWKCDRCNFKLKYDQVQDICTAIQKEAIQLDPPDCRQESGTVQEFEAFLKKYSKILHPNHVILVDKKYVLAKMYGRMKGYHPDQMTDEQLKRKQQLCEEVLKVLKIITPGRIRKIGVMMYELHVPLVLQANRLLQLGPEIARPKAKEIKENLKAGLLNLRLGLTILKDEPKYSVEWNIVEASKNSVTELEMLVTSVCSSL